MNAKRFFYTTAGILLLVVAYSIGARRADAQGSGPFVGITTDNVGRITLAITAAGDVYAHQGDIQCGYGPNGLGFVSAAGCPNQWVLVGNVLGGAIANSPATITQIKEAYRK